MANLVAPVIKLAPVEQRIIEFRGLNRRNHVEEGEMSDMKNLTSDNYPLLAPRPLRGEIALPAGVSRPLKMIVKYERIAMLAEKGNGDIAFFYDGNEITAVNDLTADSEIVAINTRICFFPQKTYLQLTRNGDSVTVGDYEKIEQVGIVGSVLPTSPTAPMEYLGLYAISWTLDSVWPKFAQGDAVDIEGTLRYKSAGTWSDPEPFTASTTVKRKQENNPVIYVAAETFLEATAANPTNIELTGTVKRSCPDIHHVIEWNNRLWGVNDDENVVYACKLGDPTNWKYYQGTSLDSFYAQQGSDEKWTGCATYSNHLLFMKPNSMTRVYGTAPSNFQVANTVCYGVEPGSSNSIAVINDKVFYKSSIGIMAYEGGIPYAISDKFNMKFRNVVAGTEGIKYYASIEKEDGTHELMTLDIDKAIWHKEDDVRFRDTCTLDGSMYFISDEDTAHFEEDKLYAVNPAVPTETSAQRDWMAVFGPFDEYVEDHKIYSRMSLRFIAQAGSTLSISMKMDDGEWELIKVYEYVETGGDQVYIVPRRCDRFSIKIEGSGDIEIKSLTRRYRRGSGVKI